MMKDEEKYSLQMSGKDFKKLIRKLWLLTLSLFVLALIGGLLPFKGMIKGTYVMVPYGLELVLSLLLLWACFHFSVLKMSLKKKEYDRSVKRLVSDTLILCGIALISVIASVIYVMINGFDNDFIYFVLYLLTKAGIICLSCVIHKTASGLEFKFGKEA